MLTLTRTEGEKIVIDGGITITVVRIKGDQVRIGIEAPREVGIWRQELLPKQEPPAAKSADKSGQ